MAKIIFITGGVRSGKSSFALKLAKAENKGTKVAFVATCQALDGEMKERIRRHKSSRPASWKTFEAPLDLEPALTKAISRYPVIIVDCLTLMVSNLMMRKEKEKRITVRFKKVLRVLKKSDALVIIVSNEVGLGIVPENALAREFRDIAGRINQIAAHEAAEVYFTVSGIPWRIK
jgi:adenosylcobinamide kinase/adenosylcobinamide-phosphate guanylyltransferase